MDTNGITEIAQKRHLTTPDLLRWLQRHRAKRTFGSAEVCEALGIPVSDLPGRAAISQKLRTLDNQGNVANLTPNKVRHRKYKLTAMGLESYTGERAIAATEKALVRYLPPAPVPQVPSIFDRLAAIETALGIRY